MRSSCTRAVPRLVALALSTLALAGCPEPPPAGPCEGDGRDPVLTLANRGGGTPLADGAEVEVFPPPQGGVFTELDVTIDGMALRELEFLRVTIDATGSGSSLAEVRFFGDGIPLFCNEDDVLTIDDMPVAFNDGTQLQDLDGVAARLTGTLETTRGDFSTTYEVVLRATEY